MATQLAYPKSEIDLIAEQSNLQFPINYTGETGLGLLLADILASRKSVQAITTAQFLNGQFPNVPDGYSQIACQFPLNFQQNVLAGNDTITVVKRVGMYVVGGLSDKIQNNFDFKAYGGSFSVGGQNIASYQDGDEFLFFIYKNVGVRINSFSSNIFNSSFMADAFANDGLAMIRLIAGNGTLYVKSTNENIGLFTGWNTLKTGTKTTLAGIINELYDLAFAGGAGPAGGDLMGNYPNPTIKDRVVTTDKLALLSVTSGIIANGEVTGQKLQDGAVTTTKLANAAVTYAKLGTGAVDTDKIGDGAVTFAKLGTESVGTDKIGNGAVTTVKIAPNAIIAEKMALNSVNVYAITDGAVTADKLGNGAVTSDKIINGAVSAIKLAEDSVTMSKIANNAVGVDELSNDYKQFAYLGFLAFRLKWGGSEVTNIYKTFYNDVTVDSAASVTTNRCKWVVVLGGAQTTTKIMNCQITVGGSGATGAVGAYINQNTFPRAIEITAESTSSVAYVDVFVTIKLD